MEVSRQHIRKPLALAWLLIILTALVTISSIGVWVYSAFPHKVASHTTRVVREATVRLATPKPDIAAAVKATAQRYMSAFVAHDYARMWSMLNPQIQAAWPNEKSFAAFYKAKFQDYTLGNVSLGQIQTVSYWVNPETMIRYNNVEKVSVSLQITPLHTSSRLPPEDLQPGPLFQNLPLIVRQTMLAGSKAPQWTVLVGGAADPEAPILPPIIPVDRVVRVPILMYHYISTVPANDPNPALRRSLSVSPTIFSQQMDQVQAHGYHSITLNQLMNALYYGCPLPTKPIIFTFDDGYVDAYQNAYPILKAHGFSGMFYIITGKIGWRGQMTWSQMREMLANGMQMGSHTIHHVDIGQVYLNSPQQALQELQISMSVLQQGLDIPIQHFCYPNGQPFKTGSELLRQRITTLLTSVGYVDATTDPGATGTLQSSLTPLALLRIRVDGRESLPAYLQSLP
jgi:peptidoglycan/xylan/chitin deacetylase (PgdA/CDA1 family)